MHLHQFALLHLPAPTPLTPINASIIKQSENTVQTVRRCLLMEFWTLRLFQDGLTGLHWATICGRDSIVRFLLKCGADAEVVDKVSTLSECFKYEFSDFRGLLVFLLHPWASWISPFFPHFGLWLPAWLLNVTFEVYIRASFKCLFSIAAVAYNVVYACLFTVIIQIFSNLNVDVVFGLQDGVSALHYATRSANSFAIKALLRRNTDINASDNVGSCSWSLYYM